MTKMTEFQVGGHRGATQLVPKGKILYKPDMNNEAAFYEVGHQTELNEFIPEYYGREEIDLGYGKILYFKMTNVIDGMKQPCVLDLKMGTRTWNETYSEKKIAHKKAIDEKSTTPQYGFRFCGMKVFVNGNEKPMQYSKACIDFENTIEQVTVMVREFLCPHVVLEDQNTQGSNIVCKDAQPIIGRMKEQGKYSIEEQQIVNQMIEKIVEKLTRFKLVYEECGFQLVSSSLFFFYDRAHPVETFDFKLIDFAHWRDKEHRSAISDGFTIGTESIIQVFNGIKQ